MIFLFLFRVFSVTMLGTIIQVIMAVALAIILFVIAFSIYNVETVKAIRETGKTKKRTDIFTGIKDLATIRDEAYDTINPLNPSFRNLEGSVNQASGAEYSYNFWMYIASEAYNEDTGIFKSPTSTGAFYTDSGLTKINSEGIHKEGLDENQKPYTLLLRGSKKPYAYRNLCNSANSPDMKVDVLVKNPMIKIENGGDVLSVEINTVGAPDGVKEKSRDTCDEQNTDWEYMNSFRVALKGLRTQDYYHDKWFMVTVVVQDTFPNDPYPIRNKVRVRIYINGVMELDRYLDGRLGDMSSNSSIVKNNSGHLYIAPVIEMQNGTSTVQLTRNLVSTTNAGKFRMADLSYFNYSLPVSEISSMFNSGFTRSIAPSMNYEDSSTEDNQYMSSMSQAPDQAALRELHMA
jgi:hypothetical protein